MALFADGSYDSFEQVIRAVDTLVMSGHEKENMTVAGNASALQQVSESSGLSVVDIAETERKEISSTLNDYKTDLNEGKFVLIVDEDADQDKQLSEDTSPTNADRANEKSANGPSTSTDNADDADLIDDLKNSDTDLSGNSSNDATGLSSDLTNSTDDTSGNSGLNKSI